MDKISNVRGRKILNSRGIPTIEVEVEAEGVKGRASIPEGKSVGKYEAVSLPPEEAIENIKEKIAPAIIGKEANFKEIDGELIKMDGTENKSNLGANTILGISLACARVQAKLEKKSLFDFLSQFFSSEPKDRKEIDLTLLMNIVNGGMHAFGGPDIQEYHIVIKGENIEESIFLGAEIYREMRKFFKGNIGDEGGLVPRFNDNQFPLEAISRVIAEKQVRRKVRLGLDVAASQLFDGEKYKLGQALLSPQALLEFYLRLSKKFDIVYLEDPFCEDDYNSFTILKEKIEGCLIVGDDLTVTHFEKTKKAIEEEAISGIVVKPNQVGTLSEVIDLINFAQKKGIKVIISHRSGETNDSFIADLAVACGAWGIKTGAPARGEEVAKYNRLLEIYYEKKSQD